MTDNVIKFGGKEMTKMTSTETFVKPEGPSIAKFQVTYHDGEQDTAEGVLITTSSFVAIGTYTADEKGVDFALYTPASMVKKIIRL